MRTSGFRLVPTALLTIFLAYPVSAQVDHGAVIETYDHIIGGDITPGVRGLQALAEDQTDPTERSHILFVMGRVSLQGGDCVAAQDTFTQLLSEAAEGDPWAARARFGLAECAARAGDDVTALGIWAEEVETLLSAGRRLTLANQVAEMARELTTLTEYGGYVDAWTAADLWALIVSLEPGGDLQDEAEHWVARLAYDVQALALRLRHNPSGPFACQDRQALAEYEGSPVLLRASALECPAEQAVPAALAYAATVGAEPALLVIDEVLSRFPAHERLVELLAARADILAAYGTSDDAVAAIDALLVQGDPDLWQAIGWGWTLAARGEADSARVVWTQVEALNPTSDHQWTIDSHRASLAYLEAALALESGDIETCLGRLDAITLSQPIRLAEIRTVQGQVLASVERYEEAEAAFREADTREAQGYLSEMLEALGDLEAAAPLRQALGYYGREEALDMVIPRTFSSTEVPFFSLRTDALDEVEVRLHRIDVEDHLRSMGTLSGLAGLDVDLITPDETRSITLSPPTYEGYLEPGPTHGDIEIPGLAPGIYAVEVIGETMRASSLLRVSDLEVVARSVSGDLVALVVDRTTERPVAGAEIIVTDGALILAEGQTGSDGVFTATLEEAGAVEVLATVDEQVTWTQVSSTEGQPATAERERQAEHTTLEAFCDRQEAEAGETVACFAIASTHMAPRQLPSGTLVMQLRVGGTVIHDEELLLEDGLAEGSITLPRDLPDGDYQLQFILEAEPDDVSARHSLVVGRSGPRQFEARLYQTHPVPQRGDIAEVWFEATTPSGDPVIGREVRGDLSDGQGDRVLGLTSEAGELRLEVAVDPTLPAPTIWVAGVSHTIELTDSPGQTSFIVETPTASTATSAELTWEGQSHAAAFVRLYRIEATPQFDAPELAPSWWPRSFPASGFGPRSLLISQSRERLFDGSLVVSIPPLLAGDYRLEAALLTATGHSALTATTFTVSSAESDVTLASAERGVVWEVGVGADLDVRVDGPDTAPMLLTIEGSGLLGYYVVVAGDTVALTLPDALIGEGRVTLVSSGDTHHHTQLIHASRALEVDAALDRSSGAAVTVRVVDSEGVGVGSPVLVALLPRASKPIVASSVLLSGWPRLLAGRTGWSAGWSHHGATQRIDQNILDLEAELLYRDMDGQFMFELSNESGEVGGFGGLGLQGGGFSGGGNNPGGFGMGPITTRGPNQQIQARQGIDARHAPALWQLRHTDPDGNLRMDVDESTLERGWYALQVIALEGIGEPSGTTAGGAGVQSTVPVWVDDLPVLPTPAPYPALGHVRESRTLLMPFESLTLSAQDADWLVVEVSDGTAAGLINRLLAPDMAPERERGYWLEQTEAFRLLTEALGDEAEPEILGYIAQAQADGAFGEIPASFQSTGELLTAIEELAEDRVAERAEALLGLGRQVPGHTQGQAALLRLSRDPASRAPDVVGTVALATIFLQEDGGVAAAGLAEELVSDLQVAAGSADLLGQARALEALAHLGEDLPIDPADVLVSLPDTTDERVAGSLVRALLLDETRLYAPSLVTLQDARGDSSELLSPNQPRAIRLAENPEGVVLRSDGGVVAVRILLVDETAIEDAEYSLTRVAHRHGTWFRGTELTTPNERSIEPVMTAVVGRRLRVRMDLAAPGSHLRNVTIEEQLPPGTQLLPETVTGLSLVEYDRSRAVFYGSIGAARTVTYEVEVLKAVNATWQPAVWRADDGTVLQVTEATDFRSTQATARAVAERLAGQPVYPAETSELTDRERLGLGLLLQDAANGDVTLLTHALELLEPLVHGGGLSSSDVQAAGEAAFRAALALEDDDASRDLFGLLEARAPGASVTEEELIQVAGAFERRGDIAYALRAYRALMRLRFLTEMAVSERLYDLGRVEESLRLTYALTRSYPDIDAVVQSAFNLPQMLMSHADTRPATPEGRYEALRFRRTAALWFTEYLVRYGDEDDAAEAALILLSVLDSLESWDRLLALSQTFSARYSDSEFLDSFVFFEAYGYQRQGRYDEAIAVYERILEEEFNGEVSADRDRAQLAVAQIRHARGELEAAIEGYREVADLFSEANAVLHILEDAEVRVPALIEGPPGEPLTLDIRVRATEELRIWAYQIDLERLFLRESMIRPVEDINLAGIEPVLDIEVSLPVNYGSLSEHEVTLDLPAEGAYLILVRSPTDRASSLAIVSSLQVDLVDDPYSNVLHVSVANREGEPVEGARVRATWAESGNIDSEYTDLRGGVHFRQHSRASHILTRVGDSYAVYRGADPDEFALPSDVDTGWDTYAAPASLIDGQQQRAIELQLDNVFEYQENVFRNRASGSNFALE